MNIDKFIYLNVNKRRGWRERPWGAPNWAKMVKPMYISSKKLEKPQKFYIAIKNLYNQL